MARAEDLLFILEIDLVVRLVSILEAVYVAVAQPALGVGEDRVANLGAGEGEGEHAREGEREGGAG